MTAKPKRKSASSQKASPQKAAPQTSSGSLLPVAGEVVAHEGLTLLEVADAGDLSAIHADARLKDFILTRLSPTEAVVLPQHSQALIKALLRAGHTPKVG